MSQYTDDLHSLSHTKWNGKYHVVFVAIKGKCHPSLSENVTDHKPSRYNLLYLGIKEVI